MIDVPKNYASATEQVFDRRIAVEYVAILLAEHAGQWQCLRIAVVDIVVPASGLHLSWQAGRLHHKKNLDFAVLAAEHGHVMRYRA